MNIVRSVLLTLILFTLVIPSIGFASTVFTSSQTGTTIYPSTTYLHLLRYTPGSAIGEITWSGFVVSVGSWSTCKVDVRLVNNVAGLKPELVSASCSKNDNIAKVTITVKFSGTYQGGDIDLNPFSSINVVFYDSKGNRVSVAPVSAQPIQVTEVKVTDFGFSYNPIDTKTIRYVVYPQGKISVPATIYIIPIANVNIKVTLSDYVSVDTTLTVKYTVLGKQYTTYITIPKINSFATGQLSNIPLNTTVSVTLLIGDKQLLSQSLNVYQEAIKNSVGPVSFSVDAPYEFWHQEQEFQIIGSVSLEQISGGYLSVVMYANGKKATDILSSPGDTSNNLVVYFSSYQDEITGYYVITYKPIFGTGVKITVPFKTSFKVSTGHIISAIFYYTFLFIFGAGVVSVIIGLLFGQHGINTIQAGFLLIIVSTLVFLIPTLMGYVLVLLAHSGVQDPIGVSRINVMNIGDIIDKTLQFISMKAMSYSGFLWNVAKYTISALGTLAAGSIGGGLLGLFTGGALSQFLGRVLGTLGSELITLATLSFMASIFLNVLAKIFPIFLNVILVLMLYMTLFRALIAAFSGMGGAAGVMESVLNMSFIILILLVTPMLMSSIDYMIQENYYSIDWGPIHFRFPNIFVVFPLMIVEILILTMVLAFAFQRLASMFR